LEMLKIAAVAALAAFLVGCADDTQGPQRVRAEGKPDGVAPSHAFLVHTKEASGCLVNQTLVSEIVFEGEARVDIGRARDKNKPVTEDLIETSEAWLAFPATHVGASAGYLVARVRVEPLEPMGMSSFALQDARLQVEQRAIVLEGTGRGKLHVKLFYSRSPKLERAWFSCAEAGIFEVSELTYMPAHPFEGLEAAEMEQELTEGNRYQFDISQDVATLISALEASVAALDGVLAKLGTSDSRFVFESTDLHAEALREAAQSGAGAGKTVQVAVRPDRGPEILAGEANFDPRVRQKVAIRQQDGSLIGAILLVAAD
jgi:hypothetical protein